MPSCRSPFRRLLFLLSAVLAFLAMGAGISVAQDGGPGWTAPAGTAVSDQPPDGGEASGQAGIRPRTGAMAFASVNALNLEQYQRDVALADNFVQMRALRNRIGSELELLRDEIWRGERQLAYLPPDIESIRQYAENAREDLKCAEDVDCKRYSFEDVPNIKSAIRDAERDMQLFSEKEKLTEAKRKVSEFGRLADELDRKINDALNRDIVEQNFKTSVSLYFTVIVAMMIALFFALLFYDARVRGALFSSPSAIQFVTLFSLVIAIILFGITGILESRELSALLGGLSGYILGRYSNEELKKPDQGGDGAGSGNRGGGNGGK